MQPQVRNDSPVDPSEFGKLQQVQQPQVFSTASKDTRRELEVLII